MDSTLGISGLGTDNCKTRRESFKFSHLVRLILETLRQGIYIYMFLCRLGAHLQRTCRCTFGAPQGIGGSCCARCASGIAQAPVPLSIFRSNSKFDENSKHSSAKYTRPITKIFCTCHDSVTVVTCAKYRCDRSSIFKTRAFWIFIEFRIWSKYA